MRTDNTSLRRSSPQAFSASKAEAAADFASAVSGLSLRFHTHEPLSSDSNAQSTGNMSERKKYPRSEL